MSARVLVIDDDPFIVQMVHAILEKANYTVSFASTGNEGLRKAEELRPHLIILDIMMPDITGWQICKEIRQHSAVPIIMLTARTARDDIVRGLKAGADDYLAKPFDGEELLARISALIRRVSMASPDIEKPLRFGNGDLIVDPTNRRVIVGGEPLDCTPKEFDLLFYLCNRAGRVINTEQIFNNVWPINADANIESVKWYIWRLRKKIKAKSKKRDYIVTERGVGYKFVPYY